MRSARGATTTCRGRSTTRSWSSASAPCCAASGRSSRRSSKPVPFGSTPTPATSVSAAVGSSCRRKSTSCCCGWPASRTVCSQRASCCTRCGSTAPRRGHGPSIRTPRGSAASSGTPAERGWSRTCGEWGIACWARSPTADATQRRCGSAGKVAADRHVFVREPAEERVQLLSLPGVERSEEFVLDLLCRRAEARERLPALGRHLDDVAAAVVRVTPALDQTRALELVEQPDQLPAVVAERIGDRALRLPLPLVEEGEDRVVVGVEPDLVVAGERLLLRCPAEPLEEEHGGEQELLGQALGGRRLGSRDVHRGISVARLTLLPYIVESVNGKGVQLVTSTTNLAPRWSALALIVTAQFMVILDVAIVNVALPSIKTDLGFSNAGLQWVISAYAILFGGTLLLGGRLADLLGRRRIFVVGLLVFAASSLLCGLAWSSSSLVAFRGVQGLGGALLAPAALSLLMTSFAEGRDRNLALGIYGAASGSGAAAGVLLGGLLTSYLSWAWIFFINVPVGIAAALLAPVLLRESRPELGHRHFDLRGAVTATSGLMLLVYALTRATTDGWAAPITLGTLVVATALVAGFVAVEQRSPWPLLPLRIFRSRTVTGANVAMTILGTVTFSEFFLLTLYLQ